MAGPASVSTLLLRNVPLFAGLPESQLQLLTRVVGRKSYPRNSTVIAAGDVTDALYIVISGRLKVMMSDDEGREVILAILNQGEFFGEMGLIDEAPRSATVIAIEPCESSANCSAATSFLHACAAIATQFACKRDSGPELLPPPAGTAPEMSLPRSMNVMAALAGLPDPLPPRVPESAVWQRCRTVDGDRAPLGFRP